jgi:polar amino acid transport system substrate-binding protein
MTGMKKLTLVFCLLVSQWSFATAQDLNIATVQRAPFSMEVDGKPTGFSIDLLDALTAIMGRSYRIFTYASFSEMLDAVKTGTADAAIANISITAEREQVMDFSQPIFGSGLQIMIPAENNGISTIWGTLFSLDVLLAIFIALGFLLGLGMLMWVFERRAQPYFDKPASEAMFPAFWWALNLLVNGGFEERSPQTKPGRILAVFMVIASLFIVSAFVARITSVMTVDAIRNSINSVDDLYGKQIGTINRSTAAAYLDRREIQYRGFDDLESLLASFETRDLNAVVFDAPVLAYYTTTRGQGTATMTGPVFLRESYGIALPSGSPLAEEFNQALLQLREDGTYSQLFVKWFGSGSF